jgi:hypothetical protein
LWDHITCRGPFKQNQIIKAEIFAKKNRSDAERGAEENSRILSPPQDGSKDDIEPRAYFARARALMGRRPESSQMISLNINGTMQAVDVSPQTPLLWVLRDVVGLTGTDQDRP